METLMNITFPILFSGVVGFLGYFLKTLHTEVKTLIKELTDFTNELQTLIKGIQVQIDKGIEVDIKEIKSDIRHLYQKSSDQATRMERLSNAKDQKL